MSLGGLLRIVEPMLKIIGQRETEKEFSAELKTEYYDGPISFNFNEDLAVFSRSLKLPGRANKNDENKKFGLFFSEYTDNGWSNIVEFKYNSRDYNITHPALSPMGDLLYFASDMTGGFGDENEEKKTYDIYVGTDNELVDNVINQYAQ